ncbi:acrylyl-CoA reductase family protein [Corynebacterium sanguinis]|uniref:acrylyl-CoA reductase family protein n=1 Tax=Corynebacterium sanguinis TaxID=2594913 RepID=UPI0021AF04A9|nr:acryloyl-CoA reductase [Corynebacterium sanguinis]MCT1464427.1 acryloyl-CoA reductase [Corynebacterium sanguinis]MCT2154568.1 acryloyl-CoA reductase [Corynebacterium sanguinis]MCT2330484.1 acryloyl-CoA reductase [Corynebacterium sanguinis]
MDKTLLVTETGPEIVETRDDYAGEGDTLIDVTHSSVNYKDAMALGGIKGILREPNMVPGIDAVGTIIESPTLAPGTLVTVNGWGIGERRHGGYTPRLRIDASKVTRVPERFDAHTTAALGTAGYTAALSVAAFERATDGTELDGPVLVTGATGGVGSVAVSLLAARGYEVHAMTGRVDTHADYLSALGAKAIVDRGEYDEPGKPLQKSRYAGAIDTVGSTVLANLLSQLTWGGVATACGMAAGNDLPASVLPFILRGVHLVGINSVDAPNGLRDEAWDLLAQAVDVEQLLSYTSTVDLLGAIEVGDKLLAGEHQGRTVVTL